jgi:hypothetical protein
MPAAVTYIAVAHDEPESVPDSRPWTRAKAQTANVR